MNITLKIIFLGILLLILTLSLAAPLQAQGPLILTAEQGRYPLGLHLEILEDPTEQLTIDDVTSAEFAGQFVPSQENIPNFGYTKSVIWVRWQMSNHSAVSVDCNACKDWLLEISDPTIDSITLYLTQPSPNRDDHILLTKHTGDLVPRDTRDVDHHNLVFKLSLEPQTTYTPYLRVENRGSTPLPLILWSPEAFTHRDYNAQFGFGFYYGFIFIMVCYNLFLFFFLREVAYLYYVLSVATLGFYQLTVDGFANQYLWPDQIWWGDVAILVFIGLTLLNGLNFGSRFLLTKIYSPGLDKLMTGLKMGAALLVILSLFPGNYRLVAPTMAVLTVSIVLIGIGAAIISWQGGYRPARYFLLAWGGVLISAAVVVLGQFQILPISFFTQYGLRISVFLLVLLLALALTDRINLLKADTERANRQLRENENRLTQFLEAMPVGVVVQDASTKTVYFNQLVLKLLHIPDRTVRLDPTSGGTLAEAIEGFPLYVARTQQKYPFECLPLVRALHGESATADDIEVHLGDKRIPVEVWSRPIFDEQGNITYTVSAFRDITQRRETEAELEEYQRHLERLVAERTAELAKANEQLQQQNQELDAFAHTVAHDLQNPLANVITFTDYLVQSFPQLERGEILAILQKILKSGRKSSNIVKELLLLASVRKEDVPVGPLDMAAVISQAQQRLTPMIEEYGGEIILPEAWPVAKGYDPWIEEVWTNYMSNGLKYGGRPPRLELGAKAQSNGMIRFWVQDNGPGLSSETQTILFTEFTRLTEVRAQGHGLGLSIVRRIIEKLGGQVGVECNNASGRGCVFYFTLPRR